MISLIRAGDKEPIFSMRSDLFGPAEAGGKCTNNHCIDLALIEKIILDNNMRMPVSRFRTSRRSKAYPEDISLFDGHYSSFSIFLE